MAGEGVLMRLKGLLRPAVLKGGLGPSGGVGIRLRGAEALEREGRSWQGCAGSEGTYRLGLFFEKIKFGWQMHRNGGGRSW